MSVQTNILSILNNLPQGVQLVAVSKYHPKESIEQAYQAGQRVFGESKVQELVDKYQALPKDIAWHFIGHLQTNKVKYIAPFITLIHSVDSFRLLEEINRQGQKCNRTIPCLLQIHIAQEETKFGFTPDECLSLLSEGKWQQLNHIEIKGIMGMASLTDDDNQILHEFSILQQLFQHIKSTYFSTTLSFCELSMGMSGDYPLAIQKGSTMVRVGSSIFGERNY